MYTNFLNGNPYQSEIALIWDGEGVMKEDTKKKKNSLKWI